MKTDDDSKKVCPFLIGRQNLYDDLCFGTECEWWVGDAEEGRCALPSLVEVWLKAQDGEKKNAL